jgi:hypothetical protein
MNAVDAKRNCDQGRMVRTISLTAGALMNISGVALNDVAQPAAQCVMTLRAWSDASSQKHLRRPSGDHYSVPVVHS